MPEAPPVPLDQRVAWILRLEVQRVLRDPGLPPPGLPPDASPTPTPGLPTEVVPPVAPVSKIRPARTPDLEALVHDVDPAVRRRAALAIGRVGMAEGVPLLKDALVDPFADVRAEAAFALGLLGAPDAADALVAALDDADVLVRGRAAEGLGLIADQHREPALAAFRSRAASAIADHFETCGPVIASLAPDDEHPPAVVAPPAPAAAEGGLAGAAPVTVPVTVDAASCQLAIFSLVRLRDRDALTRVVLTADGRPVSGWWPVAYALQRVAGSDHMAPLLELARGSGVYATAFALRVVGATEEGLPLAQRFAVDEAADPRVRAVAIRALGRRGSTSGADTLLLLLGTRNQLSASLTREALAALAATEDPRGLNAMLDRLADPRPAIRAAAIAGAARIDPEGFLLVVSSLGPDKDWSVRAALARTLATLDPERVRSGLIDLTEDQDQRVRGPALEALARVGAPDLDERLLSALTTPDFVVRATAARLVGERKPAGAVAALSAAYERGMSDAAFEARRAALEALAAIGGPSALQTVRRGLSDASWPVRLRAAALLHAAGEAAEPERPAPLRQSEAFFESEALLHPAFSPVALVETQRGTIEISLNVVDAPMTVSSFVDLARAGFFNGLRIHRLVPNFVVQTGDPRGDGEGGPGFAIPDELSPQPYLRGTVGMALSGPDTGGSQFFITLSPQPHLDGRYSVFGQVTKGMDVVDQLSLDDVIERIRIWDGVVLK